MVTLMRFFTAIVCLLMFAACDNVAPTLTPTRPLSGPTLESSPTVLPLLPAHEPTQFLYQGQDDPTAASLPRFAELPPLNSGTSEPGASHHTITVTAADGTQLPGDLYPNPGTSSQPGILLLAADNSAWLDFPLRLQAANYAILVMTPRATDGATTLGDFEAMLRALGQVSDPGHLAVIGAETGADMGLIGCAQEMLCDALVVLTPTDQVAAQAMIPRYNPRPLFVAAAKGDSGYGLAQFLRGAAQGDTGYADQSGSARGAALLQADSSLSDQIITWLGKQLG